MEFIKHSNALLSEAYFSGTHESGLEIIVIPKKQMTLYSLFATKYGSMDNTFKTSKDSDYITVPDGIAHFLEHKLFENDDGSDTFSRFTELGASANAYTSNEMTAYLFSSTENYTKALGVLLDFVTHPYFTEETVQKEMGIIEQELKMYEDNPYRWMYQELLKCLYEKNTVRIPVGGTVESIHEITYKILYDCYNTFYNLNNMVLVVCGDITPEEVERVADENLQKAEPSFIEKKIPLERASLVKEISEKTFPVAIPVFNIGLKETDFDIEGDKYIKRELEHLIISEIVFGKSSDFYNRLYSSGLINQKFGTSYYASRTWGHFIATGESEKPLEVLREIKEELQAYRSGKKELSADAFERAKRVFYSSNIQAWNSTSDIAETFLDYYMSGADMLTLPDVLSSITLSDVKNRLDRSYDTSLMAITIARPEKE